MNNDQMELLQDILEFDDASIENVSGGNDSRSSGGALNKSKSPIPVNRATIGEIRRLVRRSRR